MTQPKVGSWGVGLRELPRDRHFTASATEQTQQLTTGTLQCMLQSNLELKIEASRLARNLGMQHRRQMALR